MLLELQVLEKLFTYLLVLLKLKTIDQIGFLVENLISRPVLAGFTNAAAILIILGQIKYGHANKICVSLMLCRYASDCKE